MQLTRHSSMQPLAFLYEHMPDLPVWIRRLTPGQVEQLAAVIGKWDRSVHETSQRISPLEEVEKREITRAIDLCNGDVVAAAKALGIGKTTMYRKLKRWGYSLKDYRLKHQAEALGRLKPAKAALEPGTKLHSIGSVY